MAGLPGGAGLISDYLLFVTLFAVGVHTLRSQHAAAPAAARPLAVPA